VVCVWAIIRVLSGPDKRIKEEELITKQYRNEEILSNSNARLVEMDAYQEKGSEHTK